MRFIFGPYLCLELELDSSPVTCVSCVTVSAEPCDCVTQGPGPGAVNLLIDFNRSKRLTSYLVSSADCARPRMGSV